MGKKSKRKVSGSNSRVASPRVTRIENPRPADGSARPVPGTRSAPAAEFNPDYGYVIKDLRKIGILAGSFFVILVALSFILR